MMMNSSKVYLCDKKMIFLLTVHIFINIYITNIYIKFMSLNDNNIFEFRTLVKPDYLRDEYKISENTMHLVLKTRQDISNILDGKDNRMLFIVGPCSIHNIEDAKKYGNELKKIADKVKDKILIVMRVYFEKPRTTVGWKGLINDPHLDNSYDVNHGLRLARALLLYLNNIGMPCGYEVLDTITPQYIADLISWGAIGARTVESQVHRQLVSGLSMPVGFKNSTNGCTKVACEAITSASYPHCFMGITDKGEPAICQTKGNNNCHIILRGGKTPNYDFVSVEKTIKEMGQFKIKQNIMIDCSHGNSQKDYRNQSSVFMNVINQRVAGTNEIIGIMLESNLKEGSQELKPELIEGISITDSCISIQETEDIIMKAYNMLHINK